LVKDRNAPQKHVWRAQIVLLSAEGAGTNVVMRETGKSNACVDPAAHAVVLSVDKKWRTAPAPIVNVSAPLGLIEENSSLFHQSRPGRQGPTTRRMLSHLKLANATSSPKFRLRPDSDSAEGHRGL